MVPFSGLVAPAQPPSVASFVGPATSVPARSTEESEKRYNALKANVESRKTARRLVRPRLVRPEEQPQGDTEMSEAEGANNSGKTAPSSDTETQGNPSSLPPTQTLVRKRQASSSAFGSHEESVSQGETGSDVVAPLTKKSKGLDSPQVSGEGKASATMENLETLLVIEESTDVGDGPQASNEEAVVDAEKEEVETTEDKVDESRETPLAEASQVENSQNDDIVLEENMERASGKEMVSDDIGHDQADVENQQSMLEIGNEREEGELVPDAAELEGTGDVVAGPELVVEGQPEPLVTPVASPARVDDEAVASAATDVGDISSQDAQNDEKNDEVDEPEETAEGSEKSNDGIDQAAVEIDQVAEAASVAPESTSSATTSEVTVSKQSSPSIITDTEEMKQVSPLSSTSTTINLSERARQRAMLRQAGVGVGVVSPSVPRGRQRATPRGRGVRGGRRGGRGPTTGEQA